MKTRALRFAPILVALAAVGCASPYTTLPRQHMLQFDRAGRPVAITEDELDDPSPLLSEESGTRAPDQKEQVPMLRGTTPELTEEQFERSIDTVLDGIAEYAEDCGTADPCRLSFFVHGGLNSNRGSIERVLDSVCGNDYRREPCDLMGPMVEDGERYPIFVLWNSSLTSSYFDHLLRVQRGRDVGRVGWLGAPWKLLADTGRAITRSPIVMYEMISHDLRTVPGQRLKRTVERDAEKYFQRLKREHEADPDTHALVQRCDSETSTPERVRAFASYVPTFPTKILLSPFIDAFGTVSWDVLLRHVDLLFEDEVFCDRTDDCDFEIDPLPPLQRVRAGGLARFLDHLQAALEPGGRLNGRRWEITLIGHSMGAIVVNRILQRYPDLPIQRAVYMASAAKVRDYEDSAFTLLEQNPTAEVYHLVLHPVAELRERAGITENIFLLDDLAPRGSLLVWIDNFLSKPNTLEDRTAGRFTNIVRALATTPTDLRSRIHLSVFGLGDGVPGDMPTRHSHFSRPSNRFWSEEFWVPDFEAMPGCAGSAGPVAEDE